MQATSEGGTEHARSFTDVLLVDDTVTPCRCLS